MRIRARVSENRSESGNNWFLDEALHEIHRGSNDVLCNFLALIKVLDPFQIKVRTPVNVVRIVFSIH